MAIQHRTPFDLAAAERSHGWRDEFAWPLDHAGTYGPVMAFVRRVLVAIDRFSDLDLRDVLLVCAPRMIASAATLIETALLIKAADRWGLAIDGGPVEVYRLKGDTPPNDITFTQPSETMRKRLNWPLLRRVTRTKSWTPWSRMPAALLAPKTIAISHNSLLQEQARRASVGFHHADLLLNSEASHANFWEPDATERLFSVIKDALFGVEELSADMHERVADLSRTELAPHIAEALQLTSAARGIRRMPRAIWAGTGGYRPARAIRIEARRRGIPVTGFDHSAAAGFIAEREPLTLAELAVSDRFTVTSRGVLRMLTSDGNPSLLPNISRAEIVAGAGDPSFAWSLPPRDRVKNRTPRVLYVSGAFVGFRQRIPPRIPDVVKLDWQLRLTEALQTMAIELKTQMHPGGVLQGRPHPVNLVSVPSGQPFEISASWADVLLFDVVQSTTFTMALCTSRPIVLIDHGMNHFSDEMVSMLKQRCHVIPIARDDRNRPIVDFGMLEDALRVAADTRPDPSEFRRLYAGEFA